MGRFKTQFSKQYKGTKQPARAGISKTTPDMSKSIRDLYQNNTRVIQPAPPGEFFNEEIIPDFQDLTDAENYKKEKVEQINALSQTLNQNKINELEHKKQKKATEKQEIIEIAKQQLRDEINQK